MADMHVHETEALSIASLMIVNFVYLLLKYTVTERLFGCAGCFRGGVPA